MALTRNILTIQDLSSLDFTCTVGGLRVDYPTLVDNNDGTFSLIHPDGTTILGSVPKADVTDNGDGTYTFTNGDGTDVVIAYDGSETIVTAGANITVTGTGTSADPYIIATGAGVGSTSIISNVIAGNRIATHDDGNGTVVDIDETITTLVDNGNGSFTYTSEDGTVTIYTEEAETLTSISLNVDGQSIDYVDEDGNTTNLNLCNIVQSCETTTILSYNAGTNTLSYVDEDGVTTNITLGTGTTSAVTNVIAGNRIATHDDGNGVLIDIDETVTTLVDNGNGSFTYTSEDGTVTIYTEEAETLTSVSLNVDGESIDYVDENGATTNLNLCNIVQSCETTTTLSYNAGTNVLSYVDEDGATTNLTLGDGTTSIITNVISGNRIATHNDGDGTIIDIDETITTLVDNGDGTFTYTSENGTVTTYDETTTNLTYNAATTVLTYTNEDGSVQNIDLSALAADIYVNGGTYNSATMILTLTDNDPGTPDITVDLSTLQSSVTNTVAGNRIATHNAGDGTIVDINETITTLVDNGNGSFTYTSEDGTVTIYTEEAETLTSISLNADGQSIDYIDENGATTNLNLCNIVQSCETLTSISYNAGTNTISYIDENGVVTNMVLGTGTTSIITNVIAGNRIATHDDGGGTIIDIDETITSISYNAVTQDITYTDEAGANTVLDLSALLDDTDTTYTLSNPSGAIVRLSGSDGSTNDVDICTIVAANCAPDGSETIVTGGTNVTVTGAGTVANPYIVNAAGGATGSTSVLTNLVAGNRIATHDDGAGTILDIDETITTLVDNGNGSFTYTSEDGTVTVYTEQAETLTSIALNGDGQSIDYVDENGATTNLNLCSVVQSCETTTSISYNAVTNVVSYVDEDGSTTNLDLSDLDNTSAVTNVIAGNRIATHDDGNGTLTDIDETITTLVDNGNGSFTYTSEDGTITVYTEEAETLTSISLNIDGQSIDYVDENGTTTNLNLCNIVDSCETLTSISYNAISNAITYVDENGANTILDLSDLDNTSVITNVIAGNRIATHDDGNGVLTDIDETVTTLTDNGDGTFTYTSEDGTVTTYDETTTTLTYNSLTTTLTYTNEDGNVQNIDLSALAADIYVNGGTYNSATMVLTLTDNDAGTPDINIDLSTLQSSVTNTVAGNRIATHNAGDGTLVDINETITSISYNAGTQDITYIDEAGVNTVLDLSGLLDDTDSISQVTNTIAGNRIATHNDGNGTIIDIDETITTLVDNGDGTFTYTSENGTITTYDETTTSVALNIDGQSFDYTDEDGNTTNLNLCNIVGNCETLTSISYNSATQDITYIDENGASTVLDLSALLDDTNTTSQVTNTIAGNRIATHDNGDGTVVDIDETITTLVDNGDGTFTYTSEDGTVTNFSGNNSAVDDLGNVAALDANENILLDRDLYINQNITAEGSVVNSISTAFADATTGTLSGVTTPRNRVAIAASNATNSGDQSIVSGNNNTNSGGQSIVSGSTNSNTGSDVLMSGRNNTSTVANRSIIGGDGNITSGENTLVSGRFNTISATGDDSIVGGFNNNVNAARSLVVGESVTVSGNNHIVTSTNVATTVNGSGNIATTRGGTTSGRNSLFVGTNLNVIAAGDQDLRFGLMHGIGSTINLTGSGVSQGTTMVGVLSSTINNSNSGNNSGIQGMYNTVNSTITSTSVNNQVIINTSGATLGNAAESTIIGGRNHNLPDGMGRSMILGGNNIDPTTQGAAVENDQIYMPYLHLWGANGMTGPQTLPTSQGIAATPITEILVVDPDDEYEVKKLDICTIINANCPFTAPDGSETIVVAGANVTVTGTGTAANPYVISSAGTGGGGGTTSAISNTIAGNLIATHNDGAGLLTNINESITSISYNAVNHTITYTDEAGANTILDLDNPTLTYNSTTNILTHTAPDGSISTIDLSDLGNVSNLSNVIAGNRIATHTNGDGVSVDIDETITSISYNAGTQNITYVDEAGVNTVLNLSGLLDDTDTTYTLTNPTGSIVRLSGSDGSTNDVDICNIVTANCAPDGSETIVTAGTNVTVTGTGTSADPYVVNAAGGATGSTSVLTNLIAGNRIATHDDGAGTILDIDETVTTLVDNGDDTWTYTSEDGTQTTISNCCNQTPLPIYRDDTAGDTGINVNAGAAFLSNCTNPTYSVSYNPNIFTNVSVSATGVLTYDVILGVTVGEHTISVQRCCDGCC